MVAVAEVEAREQRQVEGEQAQRRVRDVQTSQTQVHNVTQLTAALQLTWGREGEGEREKERERERERKKKENL